MTCRQETLAALKRAIAAPAAPLEEARDMASLLSHGFHECAGEAHGDHTAALAFALSCAELSREAAEAPVLFCALRGENQETGRLYAPGLAALGLGPDAMLYVSAPCEKDLYWVAEQSLAASGLAAIVLCPGSRDRFYDFTVSRRLKLRSERSSVPLFLVRPWHCEGASAATARWRVSRLPGLPDPLAVPGRPLIGRAQFRLHVERGPLFRHQRWEFAYDEAGRFRLAAVLADRPVAEKNARAA